MRAEDLNGRGSERPELTTHWLLGTNAERDRLMALSDRMFLASYAVTHLAQQPAFRASTEELAPALGLPPDDLLLEDVLGRLSRRGIIEFDTPEPKAVRLCKTEELSVADIAEAVGDWLVTADCETSTGHVDLNAVLSELKQQMFTALQTMGVLSLLGVEPETQA